MKKNVSTIKPKQTGKGAMTLDSMQNLDEVIAKQQAISKKGKTVEPKSGNVKNPFNTMSDAKTNLDNVTQRCKELYKALIKQNENEGISIGLINTILDLANGRVSKKGKAELLDLAIRLKNKSEGNVESKYYKANDVLRHQVVKAQNKQGKNADKPLDRKEMFKLLGVGKKMSVLPHVVHIDFVHKSQEQIEKEKLAEKNAKAKKLADEYQSHKNWFMSLTINEFDALHEERKTLLKAKAKK